MNNFIFIILFALFYLFESCSYQEKQKDNKNTYIESSNDTDNNKVAHTNKVHKSSDIKNKLDYSFIQGVWFEEMNTNALFAIDGDSIFYVDNLSSYPYEISDDTLVINFDGWKSKSLILKVDNNSLYLKDISDGTVIKLFREEN
jgi:archaellum component FlaF (FlaF/FlaG flagellin family)